MHDEPDPAIHITPDGLAHTTRRHTIHGYPKYADKSKFYASEDIAALIHQTMQQKPTRQLNGSFCRTVDIGRDIGVDRANRAPTSIMTVITRANGDLITAFPGPP